MRMITSRGKVGLCPARPSYFTERTEPITGRTRHGDNCKSSRCLLYLNHHSCMREFRFVVRIAFVKDIKQSLYLLRMTTCILSPETTPLRANLRIEFGAFGWTRLRLRLRLRLVKPFLQQYLGLQLHMRRIFTGANHVSHKSKRYGRDDSAVTRDGTA